MTIKSFFKKSSKAWAILLAIAVSGLLFIYRDYFVQLQGYGLLGLFLLSIIGNATIIFPAPIVLTAFVGGAVFNPFVVAVVVSLGATIGELTGYFAGRGTEGIIPSAKMDKVKSYMEKYGIWTLFVLAVIPNPLFDLAGIAAGTTGVPVKKYFIVVWLGKLIKFGVIALLGSQSILLLDKYI
jgi:uncharacterized membrane protein YdjX (TVP38/TMEM64 family)